MYKKMDVDQKYLSVNAKKIKTVNTAKMTA